MSDPVADMLRQAANSGAAVSPSTGESSSDSTAVFLRAAANTGGKSIPTPTAVPTAQNAPASRYKGDDAGAGAAFVNGFNRAVPFGNKITSGMGAIGAKIASPITGDDRSLSDLYDQAQANAETTAKAHVPATLAGMGTGIVTSLPILKGAGEAVNAAAAPAINSVSSMVKGSELAPLLAVPQTLRLRALQGAAMAAPLGAAYGAGEAEPGKMLEGAKTGAEFSAALGAGGSLLNDTYNAVRSLGGDAANIPTADDIRQQASALYKAAAAKGGTLSSDFTDKFVDTVQGMKPQTEMGKIVNGETPFTQLADKLNAIKGRPMSLDAAQEIDEALGDAIDANTDMGRPTKQGVKLLNIQSTLRNMISDASESEVTGGKEGFDALDQARDLWAQSRKMGDIERIINRASLMDNSAMGVKTGFRTLLSNPSRMRGFTDDEAAAIKDAATSGNMVDTLRIVGSRLNPIIAAASGGGLGAAAAANVVSAGARDAATALQMGKASNIAKIIANGGTAPAKQLGPSIVQRIGRSSQPEIQNATAETPAEAQKMLPAPEPEVIVNSSGTARQQTGQEIADATANRQRATQLGLTPDIQRNIARVEVRQKMGPIWDSLEQAQQQKIYEETDKAFAGNKNNLAELIDNALQDAKDEAGAKEEAFSPTSMGQALLNAKAKLSPAQIAKLPPSQAMQYLKNNK